MILFSWKEIATRDLKSGLKTWLTQSFNWFVINTMEILINQYDSVKTRFDFIV